MNEATTQPSTAAAISCSLPEDELAQRRQEVARDLFAFAERAEELTDGYHWRFNGDGDWHARLLAFVAAERRCCTFFRIELVFAPALGPVWLTLRGPDGTKAFIKETFGNDEATRHVNLAEAASSGP